MGRLTTTNSEDATKPTICIAGGGAAAIFASIHVAKLAPGSRVIVLEKTKQFLSKVRISGGGRCNVTHSCFDPKLLVQNYPRGSKALQGPFSRFQPKDTIQWFENHGVRLKTEADGRMFPTTDDSITIVNSLLSAAHDHGVELRTHSHIESIASDEGTFTLALNNDEKITCHRLLLATGNSTKIWEMVKTLGHNIIPPLPSLFTFNTPNNPLLELAGVSVADVHVKIKNLPLEQRGPILITHWGFSGPAILKLSAWGARLLHAQNYKVQITINWIPQFSEDEVKSLLLDAKSKFSSRLIYNESAVALPRNLWKKLCQIALIAPETRWSQISKASLIQLVQELRQSTFDVDGKSTNKDEFVTCGGVDLTEIDFKTMQSKKLPYLYFAGEIIDIDGVTGGFNFQNAWTTAWVAAHAIANSF